MTRDELWSTAKHVWTTAAQELARMESYLDPGTFKDVVASLAACKGRIVTSGCGTSAVAARKIAHSLSCVERPSFFLTPSDAVHGALGSVQPKDIGILISKGGNTAEIRAMLGAFQEKGVPIIAVTEHPESSLGVAARIVVPVKIEREADEFNMLATTSTMAVVAYFDAVCIAVMRETGFT
ncbi:MAG: SIS domain-containing protein, partial [Spirochaetales bacterium]